MVESGSEREKKATLNISFVQRSQVDLGRPPRTGATTGWSQWAQMAKAVPPDRQTLRAEPENGDCHKSVGSPTRRRVPPSYKAVTGKPPRRLRANRDCGLSASGEVTGTSRSRVRAVGEATGTAWDSRSKGSRGYGHGLGFSFEGLPRLRARLWVRIRRAAEVTGTALDSHSKGCRRAGEVTGTSQVAHSEG